MDLYSRRRPAGLRSYRAPFSIFVQRRLQREVLSRRHRRKPRRAPERSSERGESTRLELKNAEGFHPELKI